MGSGRVNFEFRVSAWWLAHESGHGRIKLSPGDDVATIVIGRVAIYRDLVDSARSVVLVPKTRNPGLSGDASNEASAKLEAKAKSGTRNLPC